MELESESILVDEHRRSKESAEAATVRKREELFQKYDSKLKEVTQVSHIFST